MYAVISDIHGNLEALEAVLDDIPEGVDEVYCLGDVIGYGASPNECCDRVREREIPVISGNHDLAVTDPETDLAWFNPVAARAVEWTRERITAENASFLYSLPRTMSGHGAFFVHGSVRDPDEYIMDSAAAEKSLSLLAREHPEVALCFFGHTHVKAIAPFPGDQAPVGPSEPIDLSEDGPYLVNPGSVGQPRDGDTFASYVLAEGTEPDSDRPPSIAYRFVEYDLGSAQEKIRAAGLPAVLADRLAQGR
ncbi:metallophosphoesterase family protein [Rubrobacter aplysinae]|uniref:metallophosphoesterase family protein n=1 Tax=Rubrobacter aplysinae TaxID=909625 RepID=UPI00064C015F|nr:metallophosphoesterase family protein [Rubrobacter aplysinae]